MKNSMTTRNEKEMKSELNTTKSEQILGYNNQERMQLIRQSYIDIINIVSDAIYVLDESFTFIEINKGAEIMYQYSREELIGLNPMMVAAPGLNDMNEIEIKLKDVLENGEPVRFDFWAMRKNGEVFPKEVIVNKGSFFNQNVLIATARDITSRKKTEKNLQESEKKYRELINNSPDAIVILNATRILYVNNKCINLMRANNEADLLRHNMFDFIHFDYADIVKDRVHDILENRTNLPSREYKFIRMDGSVADGEVKSMFIEFDGKPAIQIIVSDITERKFIEDQLRKNEERYRILTENTNDVIWKITLEGKYTYVSPSVYEQRGYTVEEVMNQSLDEVICPEFLPIVWEKLENSLKEFTEKGINESEYIELEQPCKNGTTIWTESSARIVFDENNQPVGFVGVSRNITARKSAEEEVKGISNHYQAIIEKSPDGFVLLNEQGKFKYASPSALKIFGYTSEELIHYEPSELTHPEDLQLVLDLLTQLFQNPTHTPVLEYRFKHKNGNWYWIESTFSNLLNDSNVNSILINYRFIHDRKLVEEKVLKNTEMLSVLLKKTSELIESNEEKLNFEKLTQQMLELSGAKYASFNLFEANGLDFRTVALVGMNNIYAKATEFLGFDLKKKIWQFDPVRDQEIKNKIITPYKDMIEVSKNKVPKSILKIIQKTLNLGEVDVVNISNKNKRIGDFTLYFDTRSTLQNHEFVELFANQVAMFIERKLAEQSLKESQMRLNRAELTSKSGNWEYNTETHRMYVSEGANTIYGLDNKYYKFEDVRMASLPEYRPMMDEAMKNMIENDLPYNVEFQIKTANTSEVKDIQSSAYYKKKDNVILGIIQDITQRKKIERQLVDNDIALNKLIISSLELIEFSLDNLNYKLITDTILTLSGAKYASFNLFDENGLDFTTVAISGLESIQSKIKNIFGLDFENKKWKHDPIRAEKIKHSALTKFDSFVELTSFAIPKKISNVAQKMFSVGEVWVLKVSKCDKTVGDFTLIFSDKTQIKNQEISELYSQQVALFIERINAEKALRESERKYRILFAENPQPMLVYNLETLSILEVNQTAIDFYGFSRDEFLSMTVKSLHPKEEIPNFLQLIEKTKQGEKTDGVSIHQKKNGEKIYVNILSTSAPIFGNNARHVLVIDITERLIAENALIEKMNDLTRFHKLTVDRELNMISLKKEINQFLINSGQEPRYKIIE